MVDQESESSRPLFGSLTNHMKRLVKSEMKMLYLGASKGGHSSRLEPAVPVQDSLEPRPYSRVPKGSSSGQIQFWYVFSFLLFFFKGKTWRFGTEQDQNRPIFKIGLSQSSFDWFWFWVGPVRSQTRLPLDLWSKVSGTKNGNDGLSFTFILVTKNGKSHPSQINPNTENKGKNFCHWFSLGSKAYLTCTEVQRSC